MTPTPAKHEGCALASCPDFVPRPELETLVEGLRRELSGYAKGQAEILSRIDAVLVAKTEDARAMGALQADVRRLGSDVSKLQSDLANVREKSDAPRDSLLRFFVDVAKLALAAGLGYLLHRGGH